MLPLSRSSALSLSQRSSHPRSPLSRSSALSLSQRSSHPRSLLSSHLGGAPAALHDFRRQISGNTQLLDSCLKSPLLPAYLAAAFCKKLSRLSLSVPPSGALVITALIHNLLRRHPSINCLVHQVDTEGTAKENSEAEKETAVNGLGIDHFDEEEMDPLRTNAMRSSLWEIDTLRHHYCPPVSRYIYLPCTSYKMHNISLFSSGL